METYHKTLIIKMKKLIILLILTSLYSCKKDSVIQSVVPEPDYVGVYNSQLSDTAFVSLGESGYTVIRWAAHSGTTVTFDSVKVASDNTFSDNEYVDFGSLRHSLGTGYFLPTNVMHFKFILDNNATIIFDGIKL